jgi:hypothetical protein
MVVKVAFVTVSITVAILPPNAADMFVVPAPTAVASPQVLPALLIVATRLFDELQAADAVISWEVPSV